MFRPILFLTLLLAALVTWEATLSSTRSLEREQSGRLRPLLDEETKSGLVVAGVRIETASGENFLYARSRGIWRLIEPPVNTCALPGAVERLMQSLVDANGIVLTNEKHRAKSYGFGGEIAMRITLHGTKLKSAEDEDVLYAIDLGFPIARTEGSYVRPLGTHEVWSIDQNPRSLLVRPPGSSFPPLLDPNVIPGVASAEYAGLAAVEVVRRSGPGFALRSVPREADEVQPGEPGFEWELVREDGSREDCDAIPAMGYSLYLFRATYSKVLGASEVEPELLEEPDVRMLLTPLQGEPFELVFGPPSRSGSRKVANLGTQTLFEIDAETAELMLPAPEQVAREENGNPWHDYIQVNPLAGADPLLAPLRTR